MTALGSLPQPLRPSTPNLRAVAGHGTGGYGSKTGVGKPAVSGSGRPFASEPERPSSLAHSEPAPHDHPTRSVGSEPPSPQTSPPPSLPSAGGSVIDLDAARIEPWEAELTAEERRQAERAELEGELAGLYRERERLRFASSVWEGPVDRPGSRLWTLARVDEEIVRVEGMLA